MSPVAKKKKRLIRFKANYYDTEPCIITNQNVSIQMLAMSVYLLMYEQGVLIPESNIIIRTKKIFALQIS